MEKDRIIQSKIVRRIPVEEAAVTEAVPTPKKEKVKTPVVLDLNQEELDKKIEEALSEDLTK